MLFRSRQRGQRLLPPLSSAGLEGYGVTPLELGTEGGYIEITADRIDVLDGGLIQVQSEGSGIAGDLRINARDLNVLGGQISSDARAFDAVARSTFGFPAHSRLPAPIPMRSRASTRAPIARVRVARS